MAKLARVSNCPMSKHPDMKSGGMPRFDSCRKRSDLSKFDRVIFDLNVGFPSIKKALLSHCAQQASELMIPTDETARQMFFLEAFLTHNKPLLFIGPTGTGKSAITNNYIIGMPKEKYEPDIVWTYSGLKWIQHKKESNDSIAKVSTFLSGVFIRLYSF